MYLSDSFFSFRRLVFWVSYSTYWHRPPTARITGDSSFSYRGRLPPFSQLQSQNFPGQLWLSLVGCLSPTNQQEGLRSQAAYTAVLPGWWAEWARFLKKEELVRPKNKFPSTADLPAPACPWQASSIYSSCLCHISETSD